MNLKLQHEQQRKKKEIVNSGDARWTLANRGGDRGYAPKQKLELGGKDGGPVPITVIEVVKDYGDDTDI